MGTHILYYKCIGVLDGPRIKNPSCVCGGGTHIYLGYGYVPRSKPPVQASTPALKDTHFNLTSVLKTPFSTKTEEKCIVKPILINFQLFWPSFYAGKSVLEAVTRRKISSLDPLLPQNPFPKPLSWKTRNAHTYQFFFELDWPPLAEASWTKTSTAPIFELV